MYVCMCVCVYIYICVCVCVCVLSASSFYYARSQNCEKLLLASSCVSVRMEQLGSHWTDFYEI